MTPSATGRFIATFDQRLAEGAGVFLRLPTGEVSWAEAREAILRRAGGLAALGLRPGDRVLLRGREDRAVILTFLACLRAGITPVLADAEATDAECAEIAGLCDVAAVIADRPVPGARRQVTPEALPEGAPVLPPPEALPEVALMVLTSGTTSTPKAVELTHANLLAQMDSFAAVYGFGPAMRLMNLLPLHHVDGLLRGPFAALWFGASVDRALRFSVQAVPAILQAIAPAGITHFVTVPAMLRILERVGQDQPRAFRHAGFAFVLCSADLLDAALWRRFEATFGVPVVNAYGLSEVVCDALFAGPDPATRRIGSLGRPEGVRVAVLGPDGAPLPAGETGELALSGPTVMRGYFAAPQATAAVLRDGWFHTGDLVRQAPDGLYDFVGRQKTAIVSAGMTIHPETATQALAAMPGMREAVAFGLPDPALGEKLVAVLVPEPGAAITPATAAAHLRGLISAERAPRDYRLLDALPRNAAGKVVLARLQELWSETRAALSDPDQVREVAARCFNLDPDQVDFDSTPFNTDNWDSLAHMGLIDALEEAYGIRFSALQIALIASLGDARDFVAEELAKR